MTNVFCDLTTLYAGLNHLVLTYEKGYDSEYYVLNINSSRKTIDKAILNKTNDCVIHLFLYGDVRFPFTS